MGRIDASGGPLARYSTAWVALWLLLSLSLAVAASAATPKTFVISSATDTTTIFKCSRERSIGSYNEYYVSCELQVPDQEALDVLEIWNATLDGSALAPADTVHSELLLQLNSTLTAVRVRNSSILASAVEIHAHSIEMDEASAINVSARGLKFGPGYYSWLGSRMGASYGGIGGASLSMLHSSCEQVEANRFFRDIGDASGTMASFRGYGSGGGSDDARGGGRIVLQVNASVHANGSLLAVGADACSDCSDSAGSGMRFPLCRKFRWAPRKYPHTCIAGIGGTIILSAGERIYGSPSVKANGGQPALYDSDSDEGGGGGGGGGRIVFDAAKGEELNSSSVEAFGGGQPISATDGSSVIGWCQLGADGTILKIRHDVRGVEDSNDSDTLTVDASIATVSTLLVKGGRLAHAGPAKRIQIYGCTPIYDFTSQGDPFLPEHVANVFITGGAAVCTESMHLKLNVSNVASSVVLNALKWVDQVDVSAAKISIQGYIGPPSLMARDLFAVSLDGETGVAFLDAYVMVRRLGAASVDGGASIDQYTEIQFLEQLLINTQGDIQIKGFLQPIGGGEPLMDPFLRDSAAVIKLTTKRDLELSPQTVQQLGATILDAAAGGTATINMPFGTPFLKLRVSARNVTMLNVNSGPLAQCEAVPLHGNVDTCQALNSTRDPASSSEVRREEAEDEDAKYAISVFASDTARIGNVSAGSILLCSANTVVVFGTVSSSSLGCVSGVGPGASQVIGDASGGAGHGGRGGNVLPGSSGGGKAYDSKSSLAVDAKDKWPIWPGSGAASGDTPNKLTGGNGGGLVYVGAKRLDVEKGALVGASGGQGSRGGGGGAGGSIMIVATEISGGGVIDASGGEAAAGSDSVSGIFLLALGETTPNSTAPESAGAVWDSDGDEARAVDAASDDDQGQFGGGGGGGIVRVTYQDGGSSPCPDCGGEQFAKDGGVIAAAGGKGKSGGESGGDGILIASNCQPGRGGALCLPCPAGSHSPEHFSKCAPCDPGSFSDHAGTDVCALCPLGEFNADFGRNSCTPCPAGAFAAETGRKQCQLCAPGTFAADVGCSKCAGCPIGSVTTASGSANCSLCGVGETTLVVGSTECHACTRKPDHAAFNMRGNCSYACDKGRTGLDCLTPFERLIQPIGGLVGFLALVALVTGLIFGMWAYLSRRSAEFKSLKYDAYRAQRERDEQSLMSLTRDLTPRLTDQDLGAHVARLYLDGDNDPSRPWRLYPYFLPVSLRDIVEDGAYAEFAAACNALLQWDGSNGWEAWGIRLTWCLVPPLGELLLRRRQLVRVERLAKYVGATGARFFREMNFRVYAAKTKVGFSPDFSLTYVDVLMSSSPDSGGDSDMVLVVAGSGSFFRPFHLDTNDVLVRAVPSQLALLQQSFWIEFVADVNALLRVLPQPTARARRVREAAEVTCDVLFLVQEFNKQHVDDGFKLEFGSFSVARAATSPLDSNAQCFERFQGDADDIERVLEDYASGSPFKLAFRVARLSSSAEARLTARQPEDDDACAPDDVGTRWAVDEDPRPAAFRLSQIRMEALFAAPEASGSGAGDSGGGSFDDDGRRPLLSPRSRRDPDKPSRERSGWVVRLCGRLAGDDSALHRAALALWQPLYPLFRLRHERGPVKAPPARAWTLPAALVLLVTVDMAVAFWILMEFYCVQVGDPTAEDSGCSRAALWSVLGILPAAIIGAPLLGLAFVTRKSAFYGKQFAIWNAGSVVNLLVAFACGLVFVNYIHEWILLVIAVGLLVKMAEKRAALRCLAQYAAERPLRGWRGLSTTRDWYDAAYTPLAHHEH